MDTSEMREVSVEIELFSNNGVTGRLLQVETGWRDQISGSQEVSQFLPDVPIRLLQYRLEITGYSSVLATYKAKRRTGAEITGFVLANVLVDLSLDTVEAFVETFFDDHSVKVSRQEHLVVLWGIRVVGAARSGNGGVKLSQHEAGREFDDGT